MAGTTIAPLTGSQFAARLARTFPNRWASDDAKQTGNVHSFLLTIGNELSDVLAEVIYTLDATRLQTETSPELDLASVDFFGQGALPRPAGMSDAAYAQLIINNLFKAAATRPAIFNALLNLTGAVPRLLEPWNVGDTGAWGVHGPSYWNADTVSNPSRWGNGSLRYQGFVETPPPQIPAVGVNNPVLCWGDGAYWNHPGYFLGVIQPASLNGLYNTLNNIKALGTTIWVKIVAPSASAGTAPSAATNLATSDITSSSVVLTWGPPTTGTTPFSYTATYQVSGTNQWLTGPTVQTTTTTISGLQANVTYQFEIITRNAAGTSTTAPVNATTLDVPPSPVTNLTVSNIGPTAVTLTWGLPTSGTPPFAMQARYRVTGTQTWTPFGSAGNYTNITVTGLQPSTEYDFDVTASN